MSLFPLQRSLLSSVAVQKSLSPGRLIVVFTPRYHYSLAVLLQNKNHTFTILMLCNHGDDKEDSASSLVNFDLNTVRRYEPVRELFTPEGEVKHTVVEIKRELLVGVANKELRVEPNKIISDYKERQLPRFQ